VGPSKTVVSVGPGGSRWVRGRSDYSVKRCKCLGEAPQLVREDGAYLWVQVGPGTDRPKKEISKKGNFPLGKFPFLVKSADVECRSLPQRVKKRVY
jgi:hypothetical protein